jgi:DNA-binding CsgD family transcriptional regulator
MARGLVDGRSLSELVHGLEVSPIRGTTEPVALASSLLATLRHVVPADIVIFNDLAPHRRVMLAQSDTDPAGDPGDVDCDPEMDRDFFKVFWSSAASHPDRTGDRTSPTTLTDFMSLREWRSSTMHAILARNTDFDRQLLLPLGGPPGHSRRLRFLRFRGRDFDDTDRALVALIRPHLVSHLHGLDLASRGLTPLTLRQRQLLALVADGYSNAGIARTLGITAATVRTHLSQIYARLGVMSRSEAVALTRPSR